MWDGEVGGLEGWRVEGWDGGSGYGEEEEGGQWGINMVVIIEFKTSHTDICPTFPRLM